MSLSPPLWHYTDSLSNGFISLTEKGNIKAQHQWPCVPRILFWQSKRRVISDIMVLTWLHGNEHAQFELHLCLPQCKFYLWKYGIIANRIVNYAYPCRGICIISTITKWVWNITTDLIVQASTIPIKFYHLSMLTIFFAVNWRVTYMINSISRDNNSSLRFLNTSL